MKVYIITFFLIFYGIFSFSQDNFRSEIKYITQDDGNGRIYLEIVGYGVTHLTAERDAMENLFSSLFFRGIPGKYSLKALIGLNESDIVSSNKNYFQSFYDKKRYLSFVNEKECTALSGRGKRRKLKCIISVDIQTLKEDLKINKIISDYGF